MKFRAFLVVSKAAMGNAQPGNLTQEEMDEMLLCSRCARRARTAARDRSACLAAPAHHPSPEPLPSPITARRPRPLGSIRFGGLSLSRARPWDWGAAGPVAGASGWYAITHCVRQLILRRFSRRACRGTPRRAARDIARRSPRAARPLASPRARLTARPQSPRRRCRSFTARSNVSTRTGPARSRAPNLCRCAARAAADAASMSVEAIRQAEARRQLRSRPF